MTQLPRTLLHKRTAISPVRIAIFSFLFPVFGTIRGIQCRDWMLALATPIGAVIIMAAGPVSPINRICVQAGFAICAGMAAHLCKSDAQERLRDLP